MKIIVRALALGMLLTGFAADQYVSAKTAPATNHVIVAATSAWPGAGCGPGEFCAR